MMRSLYSGVSGIKVHQTRMDVVGNNLANINTIGFKGSRTTFSDMFSQLRSSAAAPTDIRGGINPMQIGLGVNVQSIDLMFEDSSPQSTGKNTDLALTGNGLFYLRDGDEAYYTRNGSFLFDEEGHYVMSGSGYRVQGWNATEEGVINSNGATTDVIVPVGKTMQATETTRINYSGNLDKESSIIKSISFTKSTSADADARKVATGIRDDINKTVTDVTSVNVDGENVIAATITFRDDTQITVTSGYYEVGKSVPITTLATVYDSLGGRHEVTLLLDKDAYTEDENLTDDDAKATGRTYWSYPYTDDEGEHVVTFAKENNSSEIQATTEGEETTYTYSPTYRVTTNRDEDGNIISYTYRDENSNLRTVSEGDEGFDAENGIYSPVYDGVSRGDTVFDNRWRVYIAPGVGEHGPAADTDSYVDTSFANTYNRTEEDGSKTTGTMSMLSYLYFNNRGAFVNNGREEDAAVTFEYSDGNGASSNQAVLEFSGLTQYASSTTSFPSSNGNTSGTLLGVAIDQNGVVTGSYTNGMIRREAQIAVAQFRNASGLTKTGTTIYQESNNSGAANIRTVADFGLTVTSSALEMSNVDIATEFSEMIITQRGFQANSKMTTVSDEMLETLVNMKR